MELLPTKQDTQGDADKFRGRIGRHIVSADLPAQVQRAQVGFLIAEKVPFSGDTSLESGPDLQDAGGGTGRDRWYGFIGSSLLYRFRSSQK